MAPGQVTSHMNSRHGRALSIPVMLYCFFASLILGSATAELLATPSLRWTFSLDNTSASTGRSLRQGNAVVVSPGGDKLFVTANDGSLHILSVASATPTTLAVYQPDLVTGTMTECRSSVVPVQQTTAAGAVNDYLVYAVIDTPTASVDNSQMASGDILNQTSSRVIAVNLDGTLRWSITVPGKISGTPTVGFNGELIYVSHNIASNKGFLSVVLSTEQGTAELLASVAPEGRDSPLGPPSVQRIRTSTTTDNKGGAAAGAGGAGGAGGTQLTDKDLVAVAESWGDGYVPMGSAYILTPSSDFEDTGGRGSSSYQLLVVSSTLSLSAVMAPLFVDTSLWIGGTAGAFGGWTDSQDLANLLQGQEQDIQPLWIFQYDMNPFNASEPFAVTPEISTDGSELYLPGTSTSFYCVQSNSGRVLWTTSVESVVLNRPIAFSDSNGVNVLYFIESLEGNVRQISTADSTEIWQFNCENATGVPGCQDSVEAEFSVSPNGNVVYYGDIMGRISALQVATFATAAPTAVPTASASSAPSMNASPTPTVAAGTVATTIPTVGQTGLRTNVPTASPTLYTGTILGPSVFNNPESALAAPTGSNQNSENLSVGPIVGVAITGLVVVALAAFFVARILFQPQRKRRSRQTKVMVNEADGDIEADFESSGDEDASDSMDEDDMDDITVTSASDSVEVEVAAASLFSTPVKKTRPRKKRKKQIRTPPTPSTLASIQEAEDEEIAALPNEDYPKINLNDKFRATETKSPVAEEVVDVNGNTSPVSQLRPLVDDMSQGSDDDDDAPPPPPGRETPLFDDSEEEKKDGEFDARSLSPQPSFGMTSDPDAPLSPAHSTGSMKSFLSSMAAALSLSPGKSEASRALSPAESASSPKSFRSAGTARGDMSPSVLSTDSSLYTDDQSRLSTDRLSPLSAGIFGGNDQASLPDDEAIAMAHPSLSYSFHSREEPVLGIGRAPGAHYLNKASTARPKFKPSGADKVPKVKSARTKRNLNGFSGSYLQSENLSGDEMEDEARIRSRVSAIDSKKAPTFKRRSKKDEAVPRSGSMIEDTWNSFLDDLAAAEHQFFSPTHSQKSAVLRYTKDDDDTTLSAPMDDDATVRTGSVF